MQLPHSYSSAEQNFITCPMELVTVVKMIDLEGRNAIVTGASSGIGRGIALKLAENGANVVVADIQAEPNLDGKPTHEKINDETGSDAVFVETDVGDEDAVTSMVEEAVDEFGQVDILVNNAGVYHPASATGESLEGWNQVLDVDLTGVFLCSREVLDHMIENDIEGDIVNISSIAGLVGYGDSAAYCAAKGGVTELTREMALDYGDRGININAVNPGVIKTAMTKEMREDEETRKFIEQSTVSPRLGRPEDIANAVAFLASEESDFVLGHNLAVDGGWTSH